MKIFYQTLILFFITISLFILRDDVVSVIEKASSYFHLKGEEKSVIELEENREIQLSSRIEMPGALLVVGDFLRVNDINVILSKDNIIKITNEYRKENNNLPELKENLSLSLSALKKLQDMFNNQYFEHVSPSGISVGDLGEEAGYEYILIGENLAMGNFKDDKALVDAWMNSEGHRENILKKGYTEIGVAVAEGKFEGQKIWMAVQHFGTPRDFCPPIDQFLLGIINLEQYKIQELERELLERKEMIDRGAIYEGSTYFEQVNKYNSLVVPYNNLLIEIQEKIKNYNNQVKAFNACLLGLQ